MYFLLAVTPKQKQAEVLLHQVPKNICSAQYIENNFAKYAEELSRPPQICQFEETVSRCFQPKYLLSIQP